MLRLFPLAVFLFGAPGCAHVAPSQRQILAQDLMDLEADQRELLMREHFLQYREGSIGGGGGGGSGCGCN